MPNEAPIRPGGEKSAISVTSAGAIAKFVTTKMNVTTMSGAPSATEMSSSSGAVAIHAPRISG